jgi:hypothetical protein
VIIIKLPRNTAQLRGNELCGNSAECHNLTPTVCSLLLCPWKAKLPRNSAGFRDLSPLQYSTEMPRNSAAIYLDLLPKARLAPKARAAKAPKEDTEVLKPDEPEEILSVSQVGKPKTRKRASHHPRERRTNGWRHGCERVSKEVRTHIVRWQTCTSRTQDREGPSPGESRAQGTSLCLLATRSQKA